MRFTEPPFSIRYLRRRHLHLREDHGALFADGGAGPPADGQHGARDHLGVLQALLRRGVGLPGLRGRLRRPEVFQARQEHAG